MLKPAVLEKLNEQLGYELASAYSYYAMVAFFEDINLKGFAHWMLIQAQEELVHSQRIFRYILDKGERPVLGAHEAPKADWKLKQSAGTTCCSRAQTPLVFRRTWTRPAISTAPRSWRARPIRRSSSQAPA